MKTYDVRMGGYTVRMKLSEQDAQARGLVESDAQESAPVAETKKVTPANKAAAGAAQAPKKRGRPRIQRDTDQK